MRRAKFKICKKSKKADSKILSIWWFLILIIIATGIVVGTLIFYSDGADVRLFEADILADRVADCLVNQGELNAEVIAGTFMIFEKCGLNEMILTKNQNYLIKIKILDDSFQDITPESMKQFGNAALEKDCLVGNAMIQAANYPKCTEKKVLVLDNFKKNLNLIIFTASNYEYRSGKK